MFPSDPDRRHLAAHPAWTRVRDAADLLIAFMTLDGYGIGDLRRGRRSTTDASVGALADGSVGAFVAGSAGAVVAGPSVALPASAASPPPDPASAPRTRIAPGTVLPADVWQHRGELRARSRPRRPGTLEPAAHLCLTPLTPLAERTAPAEPGPPPSRCRTASPDTRPS